MRYFILALALVSLHAAEPAAREEFTLTDGRVLTGIYNADTQMFAVDGGLGAILITPDQIKERAMAKPVVADKPKVVAKAVDDGAAVQTKPEPAVVKATAKPEPVPVKASSKKKEMLAQAEKLEKEATVIEAEVEPIRINPHYLNPKVQAGREWVIGTPECNARLAKVEGAIKKASGLHVAAESMRKMAEAEPDEDQRNPPGK